MVTSNTSPSLLWIPSHHLSTQFKTVTENTTEFVNTTKSTKAYIDDGLTIIASTWIVLALIGFTGNTLLFLTTTNQSIRNSSYACYLSVLSVTDSMVLLVKLMHGGTLLALPSVKPHGVLLEFANTTFSCVLTGLELCAKCISAWILGEFGFLTIFVLILGHFTLAQLGAWLGAETLV